MRGNRTFSWLVVLRPTLQASILLVGYLVTVLWSVFAHDEYERALGGPGGTVYFVMIIAAIIVVPPVLVYGAMIGGLEWRGMLPRPSLSTVAVESVALSGSAALCVLALGKLPGTVRSLVLFSWLAIVPSGVVAYGLAQGIRKVLGRRRPR